MRQVPSILLSGIHPTDNHVRCRTKLSWVVDFFCEARSRMNAGSRTPLNSTAASNSAWFTAGRFALILVALIAAAFPAVLWGKSTLVFGDYGLFGYPLAHYHRESFWRGEVPLWNPLNDCGLPFLAQWNTLVCYPLSLIYILLPLPWSLGFYCLMHLFLAGMGMYFLANRWTGNRLAASVAGVAYAFSGLLLHCLIWPNNIAALGWMPWVVCSVERAWHNGGRTTAIAAVTSAMQMLAGAPEIILFTWILILLLWLSHWRTGTFPPKVMLLRFGAIVALVVGLAAFQLLPFLDLLAHSHRDVSHANAECAMPITGWANFLVPLFRCYQSPPGIFFQPGQWWIYSYYLSLGVLAGAVCSVWLVRERRVRLLAGLAGVCLILALGDQAYLYAWLRSLFPPLNFVNFPIKFVVPVTFCVPLLASFAIREYLDGTPERKVCITRGAIASGSFLLCVLLGILFYTHRFPKGYEVWPAIWQNALARAAFLTLTLATLGALALFSRQQSRTLAGLGVLVLIWLDGMTHVPRQNPTVSPAVFAPGLLSSIAKMEPRPRAGESRMMLSAAALKHFRTALLPDVANTYLGHRLGLYFNCNLLENMPKAGGFYSLYLPEQVETMFVLYLPTNGIAPGLADFMGVSQINSDGNPLEWTARPTFRPFATAGQTPVFTDSTNALLGLIDPAFHPRYTVFLPLDARPLLHATNQANIKILDQQFAAHRIEWEVAAEQPGLLVISQTFYHPWRAFVDKRPATLWRANTAFQAVEVPVGTHHVKLVYADDCFRGGVLISSLAMTAALIAIFRRKKPG